MILSSPEWGAKSGTEPHLYQQGDRFSSGRNGKGDRLLFWSSVGPPAWPQRGGEPEQRGDPRLPVCSPEGLLPIHAGAQRDQVWL